MNQIQISVDVFPGDPEAKDSIEELEFVLLEDMSTEDLHRVFMTITQFLGHSVEGVMAIDCESCDLCDKCDLCDECDRVETLETQVRELKEQLDIYNIACLRTKKEDCPVTRKPCGLPPASERKDWYTPPGD